MLIVKGGCVCYYPCTDLYDIWRNVTYILGIKYGLGQCDSGHNLYLYALWFTDYNAATSFLIVCQSPLTFHSIHIKVFHINSFNRRRHRFDHKADYSSPKGDGVTIVSISLCNSTCNMLIVFLPWIISVVLNFMEFLFVLFIICKVNIQMFLMMMWGNIDGTCPLSIEYYETNQN